MATDRPQSAPAPTSDYVVVARRYRPQSFEELVGQNQVSQALAGAIRTNRVGHAYLFTGARGVGKTSTARILAKALNCVEGPTPQPCNECDICRSIASGEDVDVLEIDGASNRGIDEIRQLRSNAGVRPSRARFKIYIIDEVHMLTTPAFNALLKTLEEPPEHVKFIFCTTDPEKIPITVLSRCQRFDFAPVESDQIVGRLKQIVDQEGIEAELEALQLLARRAGGSMRDSQSLLEQLLSCGGGRITADDVHAMLGTARSSWLMELVECVMQRDSAGALRKMDEAVREGVDTGQLLEQLLGHFRDMMAAAVGCPPEVLLQTPLAEHAALQESSRRMGLATILAALQILDETVTRIRQSPHVRTLVEVALVRLCSLEDLQQLSEWIARLNGGATAPAARPAPGGTAAGSPAAAARPAPGPRSAPAQPVEKKTAEPVNGGEEQPALASNAPLGDPVQLWRRALDQLEDITADFARDFERIAIPAPNRLVVYFGAAYTFKKEACERPDRKVKLEQALSRVAGRPMRLDFEVLPGTAQPAQRQPVVSRLQRMRQKEKHPMVKAAMELFEAEMIRLDEPPGARP